MLVGIAWPQAFFLATATCLTYFLPMSQCSFDRLDGYDPYAGYFGLGPWWEQEVVEQEEKVEKELLKKAVVEQKEKVVKEEEVKKEELVKKLPDYRAETPKRKRPGELSDYTPRLEGLESRHPFWCDCHLSGGKSEKGVKCLRIF